MNSDIPMYVCPDGVGQGIVPGRINVQTGGSVGNMPNLTSHMVRSICGHLVSPRGKNFAAGRSAMDYEAMLNPGHQINNIGSVVVNEGDYMADSPISSVTNLSYGVQSHEHLSDVTMTKISHVAPVARNDETPRCSTTTALERIYTKDTRAVVMDLPRVAIEKIAEAAHHLYGEHCNPYDPYNVETVEMIKKKREEAKRILTAIQSAVSVEASDAQNSITLAICDAAIDALKRYSVSLSLCKASETYSKHITELETVHLDQDNLLRDRTTLRALLHDVVTNEVKSMFALAKSTPFLYEFMQVADRHLVNATTRHKEALGITIVPDKGGAAVPMVGYLALPKLIIDQVLRLNKLIAQGERVGTIPVYLYNGNAIRESADIGKPAVLINEPDHEAQDLIVDPLEVIKLATGNKHNQGHALTKISQTGRMIFQSKAKDDLRLPKSKNWLYNLPVNHRCMYIMTDKGAVVVDPINDKLYNNRKRDTKRYDMMRVSMGDYDGDSLEMDEWFNRVIHKSPDVTTGKQKFLQRPVTMHTPSISSAKHIFGLSELAAVFRDPTLYFARKYETLVRNTCASIQSGNKNPSPSSTSLKIFLDNLMKDTMVAQRAKLYDDYVHSGSEEMRNRLLRLELTPFLELLTTETPTNKTTINVRRRETLLDVPLNVIPLEQRKLMGTALLALISVEEIQQLHTIINEVKETIGKNPLIVRVFAKEVCVPYQSTNSEPYYLSKQAATTVVNHIASLAEILARLGKRVSGGIVPDSIFSLTTPRQMIVECILPAMFPKTFWNDDATYTGATSSPPDQATVTLQTDDQYASYTTCHMGPPVTFTKHPPAYDTNRKVEDWIHGAERPWIDPGTKQYTQSAMRELTRSAICSSGDIFLLQRMMTLLANSLKLDPYSVGVFVEKGLPLGLSVDFLKVEEVEALDMLYSKPDSVGMIVTPKPIKVTTQADESLRCTVSTDIQTVNNMYEGAAVVAACAYPSPNPASMADSTYNNVPFITIPGIQKDKNDLLLRDILDDANLPGDHIVNHFRQRETTSRIGTGVEGLKRYQEGYLPIIRPSESLTNAPRPFMGIPRYECIPMHGSQKSPFVEFYTSNHHTYNPYMSNLFGFYPMTFTRSGTVLATACGGVQISMHTMHDAPSVAPPNRRNNLRRHATPTLLALEEAFDFNTFGLSSLSPNESAALQNYLFHHSDNVRSLAYVGGDHPVKRSKYLSQASPIGRYGFSVPHTQYTSHEMLEAAITNNIRVMSKPQVPSLYSCISPFHVTVTPSAFPTPIDHF
jgi:hypothetical protein